MRNAPNAIMIFAAGFGTRMGALTKERPKPLVEVSGTPLIDHTLGLVEEFGIDRIVINLHYKPDMIRAHLRGREVLFSEEVPDILETGGGLKAAASLLGEDPVFTMNSDAIWSGPSPFQYLTKAWDPDKMDALLLCVPVENTVGYRGDGDFQISRTGALSRGPGNVYSGLQIIKTGTVLDVDKVAFSLNDLWNGMLSQKRLFGVVYPGQWCDVGHPEGIALAEALLEANDA